MRACPRAFPALVTTSSYEQTVDVETPELVVLSYSIAGIGSRVLAALIDTLVAAAERDGAAVCGLPVTETVKRVRDGRVEATLDRDALWSVQTPQAFRAAILREAHDKARRDGFLGTDDATLVERLGHPVRMVPGLADNVKITTPDDLRRARRSGH